jgi:hypothetical protein
VGFVVGKAALGRFSSSTSVLSAMHSTDFSTLIIIHHHLGLVQYASSDVSNSGLGPTPHKESGRGGEGLVTNILMFNVTA